MNKHFVSGFSLVELLITLAIIGTLAAFTVPKLVQMPNSNLASKQTAMARDAAHLLMSAYGQYQMANSTVSTNTLPSAFTPYLNYISIDTSSSIDGMQNEADLVCSASRQCLNLNNGGKLYLYNTAFGGSNTTNAIFVHFDPDGTANESTTDGPGSSMKIALYYDGTIRSRGTIFNNTVSGVTTYNPGSTYDPAWFQGF